MTSAIDAHRLRQLLAAGAQLVEVLPEAEYRDEHLPGAINVPLKELDATTAQQLDQARAVVVYCWDGL
jgi:phage shock protein E